MNCITETTADAILSLEKESLILENVPFNQIKVFSLNVTNKGNSTLKIEKIRSSCKCLNGEIRKKEIQVDEVIPLMISVDTTSLYGTKDYSLFIQSNDSALKAMK